MAKAKTAKAVKAAKVPETVYISEADQYLFAQGTHYDIYKKLGAHQSVEDGKKGIRRLFQTLVWESFTNF